MVERQNGCALIEAWGLQGLADAMRIRTTDEPVTIRALLNRLVDLDGTPAFTIEVPAIGVTVLEILDNDMALQRHTRPKLNAAAEAAGAAHDATTRNLIEQILADEERHLSWLETEIALYEKLGESLYCASRLYYNIVVAYDSQDFIVVRGVFLRRVYPPRAGFYSTDGVVHHGPGAAPIPSAN